MTSQEGEKAQTHNNDVLVRSETMASSNPSSPSHFGLSGNFSADDLQELLGAMSGEHHRSLSEGGEDDQASVDRPADDGIEDDAKAQARSERKRSREKQRRCDVNRQFADLTALLKDIEAEEAEEDKTVARLAFSPTNRVDMIARTITHLERLRAVNKRRKKEVESLQQQLEQAKKAGEDTAAKLKEVMFNQPPQSKQVCVLCVFLNFQFENVGWTTRFVHDSFLTNFPLLGDDDGPYDGSSSRRKLSVRFWGSFGGHNVHDESFHDATILHDATNGSSCRNRFPAKHATTATSTSTISWVCHGSAASTWSGGSTGCSTIDRQCSRGTFHKQ